jgi:hypothetical protein
MAACALHSHEQPRSALVGGRAAVEGVIPRGYTLGIMAKRAVQVRECDRCGKDPANTWIITGPDGAPREIELCDHHGAPIANAYALARLVPKTPPRGARPRPHREPAEDTAAAEAQAEPIWR